MDSEKEYTKKAVTLHGHYGPSLMLGVKAYLYAKSVLGNVSKCVAETIMRKPYLCALDGVKACSKCDVFVEEGEGLSFTFFNGSQKLRMSLKTAQLQEYYNRNWSELEHLADKVLSKNALDLFDVTKTSS